MSGRLFLRRTLALIVAATALGVLALVVRVSVDRLRDSGAPAAPTTVVSAPKTLRIVFPEGFTRREMADRVAAVHEIARRRRGVDPRLDAKRYLGVTSRSRFASRFVGDGRQPSLEGFLFPATYEFTRSTTSKQLVDKQLEAFRRAWNRVDLRHARAKNLTAYDVLIIASMIEKEVVVPEERRLVAAVIYNRLHERMPLQIDATVRYALEVPATEPLRVSQLRDPTPYNTRIHLGLPPGPIANPGLASMQAAAHPAKVDYLYFVRKADKQHHFFTRSYAAFLEYQREN